MALEVLIDLVIGDHPAVDRLSHQAGVSGHVARQLAQPAAADQITHVFFHRCQRDFLRLLAVGDRHVQFCLLEGRIAAHDHVADEDHQEGGGQGECAHGHEFQALGAAMTALQLGRDIVE